MIIIERERMIILHLLPWKSHSIRFSPILETNITLEKYMQLLFSGTGPLSAQHCDLWSKRNTHKESPRWPGTSAWMQTPVRGTGGWSPSWLWQSCWAEESEIGEAGFWNGWNLGVGYQGQEAVVYKVCRSLWGSSTQTLSKTVCTCEQRDPVSWEERNWWRAETSVKIPEVMHAGMYWAATQTAWKKPWWAPYSFIWDLRNALRTTSYSKGSILKLITKWGQMPPNEEYTQV